MSEHVQIGQLVATPQALAEATGLSLALILAAQRNAAIWDVIDPRTISAEGKAELHAQLGEILSGIMPKVKDGDISASLIAVGIATQRAVFHT
jgi:hypothetical protein